MFNALTRKLSILIAAAIILSANLFAAEPAAIEKPVIMAFQIDRLGGFLAEPGNCPYEALRRFGRAINKDWPAKSASLTAASIFDATAIATPEFLKPMPADMLSSDQRHTADELISGYSDNFARLIEDCRPASESIVIKMVCESKALKDVLKKVVAQPEAAKRLKPDQKFRIENQLLPLLDASDYVVGATVISINGFFARFNIVSNEGRLVNNQIEHNLTIGDFINDNSLMFFAQTHPIENTAETMENIKAVPQSGTILQMVASAGLDFEKDLLSNSARESILYVNLDPTGDGGLPDVRFAAPVPHIEQLRQNLTKLKNLCMQTGIFTQIIEDKFSLVKLSYFMFPQVAVYAGLAENFLVLATGKNNLVDEISHILNVKAGKIKGAKIVKDLKRFWKIRFSTFNAQLQKFLQSPLLRDRGIPPVSNLKFLEDFSDLEILTKSSPEVIEFKVDLPITKQ